MFRAGSVTAVRFLWISFESSLIKQNARALISPGGRHALEIAKLPGWWFCSWDLGIVETAIFSEPQSKAYEWQMFFFLMIRWYLFLNKSRAGTDNHIYWKERKKSGLCHQHRHRGTEAGRGAGKTGKTDTSTSCHNPGGCYSPRVACPWS